MDLKQRLGSWPEMADALLSDLPEFRLVLGFDPQASEHLPQGNQMKTITALAAKRLGKFLAKDIRQLFGSAQQDRAQRLGSLAQSTRSRHPSRKNNDGGIDAMDYDHLIVACLLHDIGSRDRILPGSRLAVER